mgnify:CR=1 FL=1
MKIHVAICDDSPAFAQEVEDLLLKYDSDLFAIDVFYVPAKLVSYLERTAYHLFILDIELPQLSGIQLAETIREKNLKAPIIFLTSFKEYMEQVFSVNTFDYLLKPVTRETLFPVLDRTMRYLDLDEAVFTFAFNKVIHSLSLKEICYFEKRRRNVMIHTATSIQEAILSTEAILSKVNNDFVQVHTSYIVNIKYVRQISSNTLTLQTGNGELTTIPVSRKFKEQARTRILMKLRGYIE